MQSILHLSRGNLMVSHCTSIICCLVPGLQDTEYIDVTFSQKCTFLVPFFLIVLPLLTVTFTPGCDCDCEQECALWLLPPGYS